MTQKRDKDADRVPVLVSGVPQELLRWYDMEAFRSSGGIRGGGRGREASGRSAVIVKAMDAYRTDRKRREKQNRERKAAE